MRISEAITQANALRDNLFSDSMKAGWLWRLDGQIAEFILPDLEEKPPLPESKFDPLDWQGEGGDQERPASDPAGAGQGAEAEPDAADAGERSWPAVNTWPEEDAALLTPAPYDGIYPMYLVAMIDYYNQESALYQNDMVLFNEAMAAARAWWRRNHRPKPTGPVHAW